MKRLLWVLAAFGASEAAAQSDPAFSANPAAVTTGESVSPETPHRTDTATRDTTQTVAGWIKTFAAEPIEAGAPFEAPDYLGTLIEAAVRGDLEQRLAAMGFNPAPAESDGLITLSVSITEPKPKTRGLPKSPVRLEGVDNDPTDNIHDPEVRPYIALAEGKPPPPSTPMIKVTLYARRGDTRVWSGYAGAPAIGGSREEIARSLAAALIAHFGQTADLPDTEIALTAAAGELPILERH
jgi:hypothetical protein